MKKYICKIIVEKYYTKINLYLYVPSLNEGNNSNKNFIVKTIP